MSSPAGTIAFRTPHSNCANKAIRKKPLADMLCDKQKANTKYADTRISEFAFCLPFEHPLT